jgi:hypothetical protein
VSLTSTHWPSTITPQTLDEICEPSAVQSVADPTTEEASRARSDPSGTARFAVDASCAVTSVERLSTTLSEPRFLDCVDHGISGRWFPAQKNRATVRAALVFTPAPVH